MLLDDAGPAALLRVRENGSGQSVVVSAAVTIHNLPIANKEVGR